MHYFKIFFGQALTFQNYLLLLHTLTEQGDTTRAGDVAQLVEQRTENPCVVGSIPIITTETLTLTGEGFLFYPSSSASHAGILYFVSGIKFTHAPLHFYSIGKLKQNKYYGVEEHAAPAKGKKLASILNLQKSTLMPPYS